MAVSRLCRCVEHPNLSVYSVHSIEQRYIRKRQPIWQWDQDFSFFACASIDDHFYKISKLDNWIFASFSLFSLLLLLCSSIQCSLSLDHVHNSLKICIFSTFRYFLRPVHVAVHFCPWKSFSFFFFSSCDLYIYMLSRTFIANDSCIDWMYHKTIEYDDQHLHIFVAWGVTTFHSIFFPLRICDWKSAIGSKSVFFSSAEYAGAVTQT